jgi:hypothetical protein
MLKSSLLLTASLALMVMGFLPGCTGAQIAATAQTDVCAANALAPTVNAVGTAVVSAADPSAAPAAALADDVATVAQKAIAADCAAKAAAAK